MSTILHIASSSRLEGSVTREIGTLAVAKLKKTDPSARVIERDLVKDSLPHISPDFVAGLFQPSSPALALSDKLIEEVFAADTIVIEAPMYNFAIPSVLKAWIDHIVRKEKTFSYATGAPVGQLKGKKAILILGRGGVYSSGPYKVMDHQETYLRAILGFIGITEVESIYIEGVAMGPEKTAEALAGAKQSVEGLSQKAA